VDHLYASVVKVQRLQLLVEDGQTAIHDWVDQAAPLNYIPCRLDLSFVRLGKDAVPAYESAVVPSRFGILFCAPNVALQGGDRIVTVSGPVTGTFDIKAIPDMPQDYSTAHHIEVQIVETNQTLSGVTTFPSMDGPPEVAPEIEP
jgi:hypothetical protein